MNRIIALFCFTGMCIQAAQAQHNCGTDQVYRERKKQDPGVQVREEAFNKEATHQANVLKKKQGVKIIPVVFHIIHTNGPENISKAQVLDQLRILNEDYRRRNEDSASTDPIFKGVAADLEVEFRLATKDPHGHCTDGIVRVYSTQTENGDNNTKKLSVWPTDRYLNIWVTKTLRDRGQGGLLLGYAQFPWDGFYSTDGVIIRSDFIGSIGTSNISRAGRTVTHEVGHWLGLYHPFQDSCAGGDKVDDTPPVNTPNYGCTPRNSCSNDNPDLPDMIQNFMDYSDGSCQNIFTKGQGTRVENTLAGTRSKLWSDENLIATGTADPYDYNTASSACGPIAASSIIDMSVCQGGTVNFTDASYNGTATGWSWSFPGGTPSQSTQENPNVVYSTSGSYDVTLIVSNANGTDTVVYTSAVKVLPTTGVMQGNWSESFEGPSMPEGWELKSTSVNNWYRTGAGAYTGTYAMEFKNSILEKGTTVSMVSPSYNLNVTNGTAYFSFRYSYIPKNNGSNATQDALKVYTSTDCGKTWNLRFQKQGELLNVFTEVPSYANYVDYVPADRSMWKTVNVSLQPLQSFKSNLRFRIDFTSDNGNNIFLDDINIGYALGKEEISAAESNVLVVPNPAENQAEVRFSADDSKPVSIEFYDVTGRMLHSKEVNEIVPGMNQVSFRLDEFIAVEGVYFIKVRTPSKVQAARFIVR